MGASEVYAAGRLLFATTRLLRRIGLRGVVRRTKSRAWWTLLAAFHEDLVFRMRTFCVTLADWQNHPLNASYAAQDVCTEACRLMARLLESPENELHCCMLVFAPGTDDVREYVETWARSNPHDARRPLLGQADRHPVSKNTIPCALLGRDDGHTHWKPLRCFASNDLQAHEQLFVTTRTDWAEFYRSVLVFPLTYPTGQDAGRFETIGFLAFDSLKRNAFAGVPDAFEYRDRWTEYHKQLAKTAVFQLGAAVGDILAMFLRPLYTKQSGPGGVDAKVIS